MSTIDRSNRKNASVLWRYFRRVKGCKKCRCRLCGELYSFATTTGNLKAHLERKHETAFHQVAEAQKKSQEALKEAKKEEVNEVVYEYLDSTSDEEPLPQNGNSTTFATQSNTYRPSEIEYIKYSQGIDKTNERKLAQLSEEKISLTRLQKELLEKEILENNLKVSIITEALKHRREVSELRKQEIEFRKEEITQKKEMNELMKLEMLLQLQLLKRQKTATPKLDLPIIE